MNSTLSRGKEPLTVASPKYNAGGTTLAPGRLPSITWSIRVEGYVLLIGSDVAALEEFSDGLKQEGFGCTVLLGAAAEEMEAALDSDPDATIIDLPLSESEQRRLCRLIRRHTAAPIVVLQPEGSDERGRIAALEAGADDCLVKPAGPGLVVAHVRSRLQRAMKGPPTPPPNGMLDFGELKVDLPGRQVSVRGGTPHLTPKEFDLLATLAMNAGRAVKASELLEGVWGYEKTCNTRTLDVHVSRLRSKIERDSSDPEFIITVPCVGYRFRDPKQE